MTLNAPRGARPRGFAYAPTSLPIIDAPPIPEPRTRYPYNLSGQLSPVIRPDGQVLFLHFEVTSTEVTYTRHALGRIEARAETIQGVAHTYEKAGRRIDVSKNSVTLSDHGCDGNRSRSRGSFTAHAGATQDLQRRSARQPDPGRAAERRRDRLPHRRPLGGKLQTALQLRTPTATTVLGSVARLLLA